MRLLVCAATDFELAAWGEQVGDALCVVSGVGVPATLLNLPRPDPLPELILNLGIAGAYPDVGLAIGDVVAGEDEVWGDVGFELPGPPGFQSIVESGFGSFYARTLSLDRPAWLTDGLATGRGCTVSACTGTDATGVFRRDRFGARFETMEGAAVARLGLDWDVPVCEIRAISNIAAHRDMRPGNIRHAVDALAAHLRLARARYSRS